MSIQRVNTNLIFPYIDFNELSQKCNVKKNIYKKDKNNI